MGESKNLSVKQVCSIFSLTAATVGIIVCAIIDVAISGTFTWSLYPIVSIIFACSLALPIIQKG